jgi:hypothetical protein
MGKKEILRQLEELAGRLSAKVIYDNLTFPGGHCRSKGQFYVIIADRLALEEKIRLLCAAVSELNWEAEELPAEIQNLLIRKRKEPLMNADERRSKGTTDEHR